MPDRTPRVLFFVVLGGGALIAVVAASVQPYFFQFFGDANSRLVQTRMMVDSVNPGLHWIGTVWLPLPGLMFLPFSLIDPLFRSGAAGAVVCLPLLAATTSLLYRLLSSITGERAIAAGVALCFAFNPNTLYMSMTAMTETPVLFFAIAAIWQWYRFLTLHREGDSRAAGRALMWGSLAAAAATLCRYEAWPFAVVGFSGLVMLILIGAPGMRDGAPGLQARGTPGLKTRGSRGSMSGVATQLALASLSLTGIALWLWWNASQFGDPLHFHNAEYYSAAWQAKSRSVRNIYYLRLQESASMYGAAAVAIFGPFFLLAAAAGLPSLLRIRPVLSTLFLGAIVLVMPAFNAMSLYLGVAEMTRWWNSRYLLLLAPLVYLASARALSRWPALSSNGRRAAGVVAALFVATTAYQLGWQRGKVVTIADAGGGFYYKQTPDATAVAEFLAREWRDGRILVAAGSAQAHRVIQPSGIATRQFTAALNHDRQWLDLDAVRNEFTWVIVGKEPGADSADLAAALASQQAELERGYEIVLENAYYRVYRRRQTPEP
jgi:hypothetical protein